MTKKQINIIMLAAIFCIAVTSINVQAQYSDTNGDLETRDSENKARYIAAFPFFSSGIKNAEPIGPVGGTFTSVLTDPKYSNIVVGGHFQSGVYISYDEGATWYGRNNGLSNLHIQSLAVHPRHGEIIYAGTYGSGIFLTTDRGLNWKSSNDGMLNNHIIYDIEIDPKNPSIVYAASRVSGSLAGYISRSADAGRTWRVVYRGDWFNTLDYFYDVEVHPSGINTVYFTAHEHGFYRSVDNGITFTAINTGVSDLSARSIVINEANRNVILGGVWHGGAVYKSNNIGDSWQSSRIGLPDGVKITRIKGDPNNAYGNRYFAATYANGLYVSVDSGTSWKNRGWNGSHINDIAVSYYRPQTWYLATQNAGMVRTRDGGDNWSTIMGDLRLYTITGMQVLSNEPETIYFALYGLGVYRADALQDVWKPLNEGLDDLNITGLYSDGKALWLVNEAGLWMYENDIWHSIELPKAENTDTSLKLMWENKVLGESDDTSLDMIGTGKSIHNELERTLKLTVTSLLPYEENLIIGTNDGIWSHSDSGWVKLGLDGLLVYAMDANEKDSTLWISACDQHKRCEVYRYKKGDFLKLSNGLDYTRVNQFLLSDDQIISATDTGIYRWHEETNIWQLIMDVPEGVLSIVHNQNDPKILAAGSKGFVLLSFDSGMSWQKVKTESDWKYPFLLFSSNGNVKLLLGSVESGAFIMNINQ